jgi:hypothetical protein
MTPFQRTVSGVVSTMAFIFILAQQSQAQVDTTAKKDTVPVTTQPVPVATTTAATTTATQPAPKRFIIYAGPNFSSLRKSAEDISNESATGWHAGMSWRSRGFLFGQAGFRYNSAVYSIRPTTSNADGDHKFTVNSLDFPFSFGINILKATDKVFNLRGFLSAVPSFNLSVGDNDYDYDSDKIESFNFAGTVGIGVDVLIMVFEVGYNHGFIDLLKDKESKPAQAFVNVGIRF